MVCAWCFELLAYLIVLSQYIIPRLFLDFRLLHGRAKPAFGTRCVHRSGLVPKFIGSPHILLSPPRIYRQLEICTIEKETMVNRSQIPTRGSSESWNLQIIIPDGSADVSRHRSTSRRARPRRMRKFLLSLSRIALGIRTLWYVA